MNLLWEYYEGFEQFWGERNGEEPGICVDLKELESECVRSKKEKNVRILAMAADVVRLMNGGR